MPIEYHTNDTYVEAPSRSQACISPNILIHSLSFIECSQSEQYQSFISAL